MFFLFRNKQPIGKGKLSGQIFPFLLVGIVGLLALGLAVSGIFGGVKVRTCAANGADAGSLATASRFCYAFNELCLKNRAMRDYYNLDRLYYTTMHLVADAYLTEGRRKSARAQVLLESAVGDVRRGDWCQYWGHLENAENNLYKDENVTLDTAFGQTLEAARCVGAFSILARYMRFFTNNFKNNQQSNYCQANKFMESIFTTQSSLQDAKSTGLTYAFNNSCTTGDAFNTWVATGGFNPNPTFEWGAVGQECGITVIINTPIIRSYQIRHTTWNYPQRKTFQSEGFSCSYTHEGDTTLTISRASKTIALDPFNEDGAWELVGVYRDLSNALLNARNWANHIRGETDGADHHQEGCGDIPPNCHEVCNKEPWSHKESSVDSLNGFVNCLLNALKRLNEDHGGILSMINIQQNNTQIYLNVWPQTPPNGPFFASLTCDDIKVASANAIASDDDMGDPNDLNVPGLMIYMIDDVFLTPPPWRNDCTVDLWCRHTDPDTGVVTYDHTRAYSRATFSGDGIIRTFKDDFWAQIDEVSLF